MLPVEAKLSQDNVVVTVSWSEVREELTNLPVDSSLLLLCQTKGTERGSTPRMTPAHTTPAPLHTPQSQHNPRPWHTSPLRTLHYPSTPCDPSLDYGVQRREEAGVGES